MDILFIIVFLLLLSALTLFLWLQKQEKKIGSLKGKILYEDIESSPTLYAKTLPLCGRPDYIIKTKDSIIPVEFKSGKTPNQPYLNHSMQLMAYCYITAEKYGERPKGGILKYPDKEFKLEYTKEAEESIKTTVKEIMKAKEMGSEFKCSHPEHNRVSI